MPAASTFDWASFLDLSRAVDNVRTDIIGDWYRDPWGWPEVAWLSTGTGIPLLVQRLNSSGARRTSKIDVPKENFGTRPALVADPVDRVGYQALVDYFSAKLIGEMPDFVCGWRLSTQKPRRGHWSDNGKEHERFRGRLSGLSSFYPALLRTDVVSCFSSIPIDRLRDRLEESLPKGRPAARLYDLLGAWDAIPGRSGLLQRSGASAALANFYLSLADDVLVRHGKTRGMAAKFYPDGSAVRWMDDIWLFGRKPENLRKAQVHLQDTLRGIGLEINQAKTDVLVDPEAEEVAKAVRHSAAEDHLASDPPDLGPLEKLLDEITSAPEYASRTEVSFVIKRMRDHELYQFIPSVVEVAPRMPHAADVVARLFHVSEKYQDLADWFLDYQRSGWGALEWSVAQLATMFPSKWDSPPDSLVEFFARRIEQGNASLPLLAVAAQRLSKWRPRDPDLRTLLRDAALRCTDPLARRVLALALAEMKEPRSTLRVLLGEFEENSVTLRFLEDKRFAIKSVSDFG